MWKTIEFYQRTNIINLSYRSLLRKIDLVRGMDNVVRKKVINGSRMILINSNYVTVYFQRKRKLKAGIDGYNQKMEKRVRKVKSTYKVPDDIDRYNIELSINFKDNYDRDYYDYIVKDLFLRSSFDLFYVIEEDTFGFNHLHIGLKGDTEELKLILRHTYENLHLHDYDGDEDKDKIFSKQTNIAVIRNHNAYLEYLKKGSTIEFLLKKGNLELFADGK